jgi:hypothetical protein
LVALIFSGITLWENHKKNKTPKDYTEVDRGITKGIKSAVKPESLKNEE